MLNGIFSPIIFIFTRNQDVTHVTPVRFQIVPEPEPSHVVGPQVGAAVGSRPTYAFQPNFNGPQVGTVQGPRPNAVILPNLYVLTEAPQVGVVQGPRPTSCQQSNIYGPQVGAAVGSRPTVAFQPNFNGPQVATLQSATPTLPYRPNVYVAPPVQAPGAAENVPDPNELNEELLSFIESSMARVEANSMAPVNNLPTPSTSTQDVEALMLTQNAATVTEGTTIGEFVVPSLEFFQLLDDLETFAVKEAEREAISQIASQLANDVMMQSDEGSAPIPQHVFDFDVFDTLMGLAEKGEMYMELVECPLPRCNKTGPPNGLDNHYMMAQPSLESN